MKAKKNISMRWLIIAIIPLLLSACKKDDVVFSSTESSFTALQIQKFDYEKKIGVGPIYQGKYSQNKDIIYFDVTYFPNEKAPTYEDWIMTGSLFLGARVTPKLEGVKSLQEPLRYTIWAPDEQTKSEVMIVTTIYEVPYSVMDKGFGKYNKLWNKTGAELGGWETGKQTSIVVSGDELIVNNDTKAFLIYDKKSGMKKNKTVSIPAGNTEHFYTLAVDASGTLHAVSYIDANTASTFRIYRWSDGLDKKPEIFYEISGANIATTKSTGMGRSVSICGDTHNDAQIMIALDGSGKAENRVVRIPVVKGIPTSVPDVFATTLSWTWRGKGGTASPTGKTPYFAASLGAPAGLAYYDQKGEHRFNMAAAESSFLNKTAVTGAHYFEFNHSKYLAASSASWSGDLRMLIFCLDDPSLIPTNKKTTPSNYSVLNPFSENWDFLATNNTGATGDITVQVQEDGNTALVYMLDTNTGILAYELTNIGVNK